MVKYNNEAVAHYLEFFAGTKELKAQLEAAMKALFNLSMKYEGMTEALLHMNDFYMTSQFLDKFEDEVVN